MKAFLALGAALGLVLASVVPYVRSKSVDGPDGGHCLAWPAGRVEYHPNAAGDAVLESAAFEAIDASVATWARQMDACGNLELVVGPHSSSRTVGFDSDARASNENLILFRTRDCTTVVPVGSQCLKDGDCANAFDCWEFSRGTLAVTTTNFDPTTGQLFDADIELNAASHLFTTVDGPPCTEADALSCTSIDVQNTVTHELGHSIGLAHAPDSRSTMFAGSERGETSKRTLDDGSLEFVCTAYPKGQQSRDCDGSALRVRSQSASCGASPVGLLLLGGALATWLRRGGTVG